MELEDGSTARWTQRPDGTWRKPERKRASWVGELERPKYVPPARRGQEQAATQVPGLPPEPSLPEHHFIGDKSSSKRPGRRTKPPERTNGDSAAPSEVAPSAPSAVPSAPYTPAADAPSPPSAACVAFQAWSPATPSRTRASSAAFASSAAAPAAAAAAASVSAACKASAASVAFTAWAPCAPEGEGRLGSAARSQSSGQITNTIKFRSITELAEEKSRADATKKGSQGQKGGHKGRQKGGHKVGKGSRRGGPEEEQGREEEDALAHQMERLQMEERSVRAERPPRSSSEGHIGKARHKPRDRKADVGPWRSLLRRAD